MLKCGLRVGRMEKGEGGRMTGRISTVKCKNGVADFSNRYLVATTTIWSGASYIYTKDAVKILTPKEVEERSGNSEKRERDQTSQSKDAGR